MRKMSFILLINNIEKANSNLKINNITNLAIYLKFFFKPFFNIKDILYVIKKDVGLQTTHNKSGITLKIVLVTNFIYTKADLVMSIIFITI